MSLVFVENVLPDVKLGLWKIEESAETFLDEYHGLYYLKSDIGRYSSMSRRLEVLAVHALLMRMGIDGSALCHEPSGKPYLPGGMNIGISHTKGGAAVIVSPRMKVSVDVEYASERVGRVTERLLRNDEKADTLLQKLLHWCTKETLYKLYSEDELALHEMQLLSIEGNDSNGIITARNVKRDETLAVSYRVVGGLVITYATL